MGRLDGHRWSISGDSVRSSNSVAVSPKHVQCDCGMSSKSGSSDPSIPGRLDEQDVIDSDVSAVIPDKNALSVL